MGVGVGVVMVGNGEDAGKEGGPGAFAVAFEKARVGVLGLRWRVGCGVRRGHRGRREPREGVKGQIGVDHWRVGSRVARISLLLELEEVLPLLLHVSELLSIHRRVHAIHPRRKPEVHVLWLLLMYLPVGKVWRRGWMSWCGCSRMCRE